MSVVISRHHIPVARVDRVKYRAEYIARKHVSLHENSKPETTSKREQAQEQDRNKPSK